MKRSNSLIADFPPPTPLEPNRPEPTPASANLTSAIQSAPNLAGFFTRRQHPHPTHATASVAPFYVETEAA
jgi:hypothetical protein